MNILIPHHWLLEHLDTTATPAEIQTLLSLSGPSVEMIYEKPAPVTTKAGVESVYDIEVTTNRVDSMSVRGIAREAAVILHQAGSSSSLKAFEPHMPDNSGELPLPTITDESQLCNRIVCVVLDQLERTPTPDWMAERLGLVDIQTHDSAVDITNYVTHEIGHPIHAFDYDAIMALGGEIIIKKADAGKQFVTLDGQAYTTVGGEVVFENESGEIIDLPAIKGTNNTSIHKDTKRILLWTENLSAADVRFASMTHAIRTTAAQLNEKHVDPHLALPTLLKAVELYQSLCHARVASPVLDLFPGKTTQPSVKMNHAMFARYLGITLSPKQVQTILRQLECSVVFNAQTQHYSITPPTFRSDLTIPADIVEEIARIYGYHTIPSVLMDGSIPTKKQEGVHFKIERTLKEFLAHTGWQELYTYSTVSSELAEQSGYALTDHLALQNPLDTDHVYLRRSLIPSLLEAAEQNSTRTQLEFFEVANVYHPQKEGLPHEVMTLCMLTTTSYLGFKGSIEALLREYFQTIEVTEATANNTTVLQAGEIAVHQNGLEHVIGTIQVLKNNYYAAQIVIDQLARVARTHPTYTPPPATAEIIEDMTFSFTKLPEIGPLLAFIASLTPRISGVELSSIYHNNISVRLQFNDPHRNLSSEELEPTRKLLAESIEKKYHATLVGTV
ncbi:MAG: phenylalanine--tRNA ligase subunit beta [Pseudomonadales bacterium]|nr:phenylalanine--tRNA ligase subunit beta [Pseudomonadales bacterium]